MPGVVVETATRSGPAVFDSASASTYFVAGLTERGDSDRPVLLRSMGDYLAKLGGRVTYGALFDDLTTFFEEGGTTAYVSRVTGAAATTGTLTLNDRAGTPQPTVRIDALGEGAWSSGVTVTVENGTAANTVNVIVTAGDVEERFNGLDSPSAIVTALLGSNYVRATNLGSATAAPDNNPATSAATALSAGADDRASVAAADYVAALDKFGPELGAGAVAIPGQAAAAIAAGVATHCRNHRRIGLLAPTVGSTPTSAISQKVSAVNAATAEEHLGIFYPWVKVPDGLGTGGTRTISPEGYVAGVRARAQQQEGPWRAPGGQISESRYVVGLERVLTRAESDNLDENEVSAIREFPTGVRLYGWRSLSPDEANYSLLTGRDVLNFVAVEGEKRLEQYVFRSIDGRGQLFGELAAEMIGLLEPIRVQGGLYERSDAQGNPIDRGYRVETGPSVNTDTTLQRNIAVVAASIRVSPTGALIKLLITKVGLTAAV